MTIADRLQVAHHEAQLAFRAMLLAHYPDPRDPDRLVPAYSLPSAPETRAYVAAERLVDSILVDAQLEASWNGLAELIAADPLAAGEHFVGVGL